MNYLTVLPSFNHGKSNVVRHIIRLTARGEVCLLLAPDPKDITDDVCLLLAPDPKDFSCYTLYSGFIHMI